MVIFEKKSRQNLIKTHPDAPNCTVLKSFLEGNQNIFVKMGNFEHPDKNLNSLGIILIP